jgi:hypothetical protein
MIQFLYRKQNCKRVFIIIAFSSSFIIVLHERKLFRLNTRRIVIEVKSCSYFNLLIVFSRSCLSVWTLFNMIVSMIEINLSRSNRETFFTYSSFSIRDIWESYFLLRAFFLKSLINLTEISMIACITLIVILFSIKANAWRRCLTCNDRFWDRFWDWFWIDFMIDWAWDWFWRNFEGDEVLILAYWANEIKKDASEHFRSQSS